MIDPFDPDWDLESAVAELSAVHRPGSVSSGKTRNQLLKAWAFTAGAHRVQRDLSVAIEKLGSRKALARAFVISAVTLRDFEEYANRLKPRWTLPTALPELREAIGSLSVDDARAFMSLATQLLLDPQLLRGAYQGGRVDALTEAVRTTLRVADLRAAATELRETLEGGDALENVFQMWCEKHPWAFGNALVMDDDIRRLDAASVVDMLPHDLFGFRHVIELKRSGATVLRFDAAHKTYYFGAEVSKALGQVHKYLDGLQNTVERAVQLHPDIVGYHPHATIVIGRSKGWNEDKVRALQGLNARLHGVVVMTYDHLHAQAVQAIAILDAGAGGEPAPAPL